jgi:tetratricopeptide (TPR) repeat protein
MMESLHIVLQEFPDFAEAYDMLGWARLTGGGANAAVEAFKKAVELNPRNEEYQLRLARAYLAAKKFEQAKGTLERLKQSQNPAIAQTAKKSLIDLPFLEKYGVPPVEAAPAQEAATALPKKSPDSEDEDDEGPPAKAVAKEPEFDKRPVKFLKTTVLSVDCSKSPAAILTVSQAGKTLHLRAADYKSALVIGGEFSCAWKAVPVNVNYKPGGKADGDLVSIEIH